MKNQNFIFIGFQALVLWLAPCYKAAEQNGKITGEWL